MTHEFAQKKQEEKEEQQRIKAHIREEKRAEQEIARMQKQAEEDERKYELALRKAREQVEQATGKKHDKLAREIEALHARLLEAQTNNQRAQSRAQMTRSGHVYVISNVGSFGDHVYKIGMTRRLEPMDRVKELGDASVPFDVHAMIYSEDAPSFEAELHRRFTHRRVNLINQRKEFFCVSLREIEAAVSQRNDRVHTRG